MYLWHIRFGLVGFYGISTILGYLKPSPLYTYIYIYIYDLVWLDFMAYQLLLIIWCQILFIHVFMTYIIWFGWVLTHINLCASVNELGQYTELPWLENPESTGWQTDTGQLFRPCYVSSVVYTLISTTEDRTHDHRIQSRNSTTEPSVHIAHKRCQIY